MTRANGWDALWLSAEELCRHYHAMDPAEFRKLFLCEWALTEEDIQKSEERRAQEREFDDMEREYGIGRYRRGR